VESRHCSFPTVAGEGAGERLPPTGRNVADRRQLSVSMFTVNAAPGHVFLEVSAVPAAMTRQHYNNVCA